MILEEFIDALPAIETTQWAGRVRDLVGLLVASDGPAAAVGDFCEILPASGKAVRAQVVGFKDGRVLLMPLEETGGLQAGDKVVARAEAARVEVSQQLLGRVLDGIADPRSCRTPSTISTPRLRGRSSARISPSRW
jgi:flagellar biosynthesis/type III secretory pathway ATPase